MSKQPDKGRPAGTRKLPKLTAKQEAEFAASVGTALDAMALIIMGLRIYDGVRKLSPEERRAVMQRAAAAANAVDGKAVDAKPVDADQDGKP